MKSTFKFTVTVTHTVTVTVNLTLAVTLYGMELGSVTLKINNQHTHSELSKVEAFNIQGLKPPSQSIQEVVPSRSVTVVMKTSGPKARA